MKHACIIQPELSKKSNIEKREVGKADVTHAHTHAHRESTQTYRKTRERERKRERKRIKYRKAKQ